MSDSGDQKRKTINTTLSFAGQQRKLDTVEDGQKIADEIENCIILQTLEMRGNTLGVDATEPIAKALESRAELRHALWSDMFTGRLKAEIPRTLLRLTSAMMYCGARLTELDLSDNAIGPMAMPGLKDFLASESACELRILNFNNCGLGIAGKTIAECLIKCHDLSVEMGTPLRLQRFVAGRNRLEQTATAALAEAFKKIRTLEEIVMPQNGIKAEGIKKLASALRANRLLRVLNLNDNTFGYSGAMSMAEAVSDLVYLESVDFGDCLCRNRGSIEICKQLKHTCVKNIVLSGNEIRYDAARQILEYARRIDTLKTLSLGTNCFGGRFEDMQNQKATNHFLDIGQESDDEGTADEESEGDDDDNNAEPEEEHEDDGNESN